MSDFSFFESQAMQSESSRWSTLGEVAGLRTVEDRYDHESIASACKRRHPDSETSVRDMSAAEIERYGQLNELLHEKLEACVKSHFRNVPVPDVLKNEGVPGVADTPFTYQNWDWYGPSYECYIVVWEDALSSNLLIELQSLLTGDHRDWCIVICTAQDADFETNHEIGVFSDEVLIPLEAIADLKMRR